MKLNGKIYLREDVIRNELEDLIILLEQGDYFLIAESIKNIRPENAENVAIKLAKFQDMFIAFYKTENYCKIDDILEMTEENLYDSKKESVSLFSRGAYGITIKADDDSCEKFIFNTCLYVFMKNIKKYNQNIDN
tara:strand:+ start:316 stop:720 length:405 start_codon:yes stop_codon:yes gene_type:complete